MGNTYPPKPAAGALADRWDSPLSELVSLPAPSLAPEEIERHRIYSALLMAILFHYWNGNKRGRYGSYPFREKQKQADGEYAGGDYLGHNIAALAVSEDGRVIDFDFNHNELLNSSVEHAESRLVRRIFSLAQLNDGWATRRIPARKATTYGNVLNGVTLYTTLESCSQCSGIMALGLVKEVVFLQRDPGQSSIGNILRALLPAHATYNGPLPIPGDLLGIEEFSKLDDAYKAFSAEVSIKPFYVSPDSEADHSSSITSFLCTDAARDIFCFGAFAFDRWPTAQFPAFKPLNRDSFLSNQDALDHAHRFYDYAITDGRRGTPHKL